MAGNRVDDAARAARGTMNMTPMIDVVFQLIVVFLCSMKFRTLDEKVEAFLPKDIGIDTKKSTAEPRTRVTVLLRRAPEDPATRVLLLGTSLGTAGSESVWDRLAERLRSFRATDPRIEGEIDAGEEVAHGEVVRALDAFLAADLREVTFRGTRPARVDPFAPR